MDVRGLPTIDPEQAACRGMEVLDFVGDKDRMTHQRIADAKAVCVQPAPRSSRAWPSPSPPTSTACGAARRGASVTGIGVGPEPARRPRTQLHAPSRCKEQQREYHRAYRRWQREKGLPS